MPVFVDVGLASHVFRGRVLEDRAPGASAALRDLLPLQSRLHLDEWSGFLARIGASVPVDGLTRDDRLYFGYPGLIMVDAQSGELAVCYGQGRLQNGAGPIPVVPLIELGGDIQPFARIGERLQYDGSQDIEFALSTDQTTPLEDPPRESGRSLVLELGDVSGTADLLERSSRVTTEALIAQLPLVGTATNTFLSGPLVRLRDPTAPARELILETRDEEIAHIVLYPGIVYYRPLPPRGLRIALRDPTTMGGGILGGGTPLVPLARLFGDWSALRAQAARLVPDGEQPLRLSLLGQVS